MLERVPQQFRELQEITMQTDTRDILAHATRQSESYEDYFLVDIDAHVTETSFWPEIIAIDRQRRDPADGRRQRGTAGQRQSVALLNNAPGIAHQHVYGRIPHQQALMEQVEKTGVHHFTELARRGMDALGLDYQVVFPTPMLTLGMHPQDDIEAALGKAYNKWLVERILPEDDRLKGLIYLPFNTPEACVEEVQEICRLRQHHRLLPSCSTRNRPVHHNSYMKLYAMMEETGKPFAFHSGFNWNDPSFLQLNRFISMHALSLRALQPDPHDELDHQRAARALSETEGAVGRERARLDSVPDAATRSRISDAVLRGADAEEATERVHARHVLYQPADGEDQPRSCCEATMEALNADTQLLYASDWPHWDFDRRAR